MFQKQKAAIQVDLSNELRDGDGCRLGLLRTLDFPADVSALAVEPLSALLAVGTSSGKIYLYGRPGAETKLQLPEPREAKFLQFISSLFYLICIDGQDSLHIWDLSVYGRPGLLASVRFDRVNAIATSPSHTHLFLALSSGEIRTYDLTCQRKSPYTMPNLWKLYAEKAFSNHCNESVNADPAIAIDIVIHPRALDQLFVAYGGGVLLADLVKRDTIRVYELVLPPGAPGGYGYGDPNILVHRQPEVTAIAVHPSGFFFAAGYTDGSIAFWAVDDEDAPLLVRTLDTIDVNLVDHEKLDQVLSSKPGKELPAIDREPIFKLSWSGYTNSIDPRGGSTTLSILGGLLVGELAGLTVIQLPPFNPPEPPAPTSTPSHQPLLHPFLRKAMIASLDPADSFFYPSKATVQDYLLMPKESPHFSGAFDPLAVMLLSENQGGTRVLEAFQYPPPTFILTPTSSSDAKATAVENLVDDLKTTLQSLSESIEPKRLQLPGGMNEGAYGLLDGYLYKLDNEAYHTLTRDPPDPGSSLPLLGGSAWSDESKANEFRLAKFQPHRLLVNWYRDLTIHFFDISAQLLTGLRPLALQSGFPHPLPNLTIDLRPALVDSAVTPRLSDDYLGGARVETVVFASEALEMAVVMRTGEVVVFRLSGPQHASNHTVAKDEELVDLQHVPSPTAFSPFFMVAPGRGPATACALSDIGFLAIAYHEVLLIINMRTPEILLRHEEGIEKSKHGLHLPRHDKHDPIMSLLWNIAPLADDLEQHIRLVSLRSSGSYDIYTVIQEKSEWTIAGPSKVEHGVPQPLPRSTFVIDSKTGVKCRADRSNLSVVLSGPTRGKILPSTAMISIGSKGAKSTADINGKRLGKVEWGNKMGRILDAQIIDRMGSHVLVIITDRQEIHVYSIPHLESLYTLKLSQVAVATFTIEESGDFIAWSTHPTVGIMVNAHYGTLFNLRRPYNLPDIDFACTRVAVPPQPQRISMGPPSMLQLGAWLPFNQGMTGPQIDDLLGGPNRPVPQAEKQSWNANLPSRADLAAGATSLASSAAATQSSLYNRLTSAMGERGQALNNLEERFQALEEGSKSMAAQAKRLAAEQSAKSWFGF